LTLLRIFRPTASDAKTQKATFMIKASDDYSHVVIAFIIPKQTKQLTALHVLFANTSTIT